MWDILPVKRGLIAFTISYGMICAMELRGFADETSHRPDLPLPLSWKIVFAIYCAWLCYEIARVAFRGARKWEELFMASFSWCVGVVFGVIPIVTLMRFWYVDDRTFESTHPIFTSSIQVVFGSVIVLLAEYKYREAKASVSIYWYLMVSMVGAMFLAHAAGIFVGRFHTAFRAAGCIAISIGFVALLMAALKFLRRKDLLTPSESSEPNFQSLLNRAFLPDQMRH